MGQVNTKATAQTTYGAVASVWPYGQINCSIFGHFQQWKFAQ